MKDLPAQRHIGELDSRGVERLAFRPGVNLLRGALHLAGRIGQGENDRSLVDAAHGLDNMLVEGSSLGAHADQYCRLERFDRADEIL